ncbi:DHA2 family efflux MFS transporter permease subunit [Aneurinibacillus thermoaerophilus]|uniref:DHA2 family efflux MFS transporter permease subunit n=1 Tax=Aneurinibacillus thermoaerophilus TaxID=143495 RepID=UPI002E22C398|nr:DHA2 family efflux MFS transporter permease subunit [Aneurinibacillus thermoaerophilus]MED0678588.1 DHA2 family efflux MFS transporter permease subunit [Aneurinibacillus thermoaerophilus]MED0765376.1 DHA2 family efflux MFS transporter permease subunit [Aneurinibacillus thermoaerophilus]
MSTQGSAAPLAESSGTNWVAFIAIIVAAFVAILNNSLINVAIPKLTNDLGSTTERIQWVLTGYMLASGVIIPISGYMGDRLGYKKFFIISLSVFTAGTLFCALAWSDTSLIAGRVIAGLGGGVIMPLSMSIIYKIIPRNQIGMALGLWGISAMVAPAVGPTLSGYLIEWFNWRSLFIVNIPVALLAIFLISVLLQETEKVEGKSFDTLGFVLTAISAGTLLYALSNGQTKGWTSFEIVALMFISFWALVFLLWVETGKEDPIIDLSLFKNFTYTLSVISASLVTIGLFGGVFLTPIFLQNIQGISAIDTGILLIPQSIAMAVMMPIAGKLFDKVGVIPLGFVGLTILSVMTYELHRLTVNTPQEWLETVLTIRGIGIGLCMMPLSTAGMNAVAPHQVGNASAVSNLIRQVAASLGIAVLTAIMQHKAAEHAEHITESINTVAFQTAQESLGVNSIPTLVGIIQREATAWSIADTFLISSIPLFIAIPLVFLFKQKKKLPQAQMTKQG